MSEFEPFDYEEYRREQVAHLAAQVAHLEDMVGLIVETVEAVEDDAIAVLELVDKAIKLLGEQVPED